MDQQKLGERFALGYPEGNASNVEIYDHDDYTALVGYGHAIYAIREKLTGEVVYFDGWYGYSNTTSSQLSKLGLVEAGTRGKEDGPNTHRRSDESPSFGAFKQHTSMVEAIDFLERNHIIGEN